MRALISSWWAELPLPPLLYRNMSLSLALAFIQSMSPENKKPLLNQSGSRVRYENSDIFYVDDGASYTSRNIPHMMVCVWRVCANMSPLASQLRGHLIRVRHPAIFLKRHPISIRYDINAKRTVQQGLAPISHSAFAVAAAAVPGAAEHFFGNRHDIVLVSFVTGRFTEWHSFKQHGWSLTPGQHQHEPTCSGANKRSSPCDEHDSLS